MKLEENAQNAKKNNASNVERDDGLHKNMNFTATEQYKLLRTNLSFILTEEKPCYVIGVTSSVRGEGKSTTAVNLSYVLAEAGKKVLLVDGDLRLPSIAKKMNIERTPGLTNLLVEGKYDKMSDFKFEDVEKWHIVPAGDLPPNPSELLGSRKMAKFLEEMSEQYEYIVIDLPPVNIVSDALAISHLLDGVLLVVREDYTSKKDLDNCVTQLKLSNVNVLGYVMNVIKDESSPYNRYRKYSRYYRKYGYSYDRYYGHD